MEDPSQKPTEPGKLATTVGKVLFWSVIVFLAGPLIAYGLLMFMCSMG
jgi:hypothetical protein